MRDHRLYLKDILSAMESIETFVHKMDFKEFQTDDKTSSAVIRKLEIIGEAAKYVPDEIRHKYQDVLWKEMSGMRDKLIHFYFGADYQLVWKAIKERLPKVKSTIRKILQDL